MRETFLKLHHAYARVLWAFATLAGLLIFAIMWIIDINALARRLFNYPIVGSVEVTQSLLTGAIMLPFAYALYTGEHVRTVLFTSRLSSRSRRILHVIWMLVGCVVFALITYGTYLYALRSYMMNEQVWGAGIRFPLWPAKSAVSLGTLLLAIEFLMQAIRGILVDEEDRYHATVDDAKGHLDA